MAHESPTPNRKPGEEEIKPFSFERALNMIKMGKKVARPEWKDSWFFMGKEYLMVHMDGKDHELMIRKVDIEAKDYFVIQ